MLRFRKLFPLLLSIILFVLPVTGSAFGLGAPKYNLDSLCFISTDAVEVSLVRHHAGEQVYEDTFTATVLDTLGGDYKVGDKIELPYTQVILPLHPCSLCILFIARKQFQLDVTGAKAIPPQVSEVLPVDAISRVHRYFQWERLFTKPDEAPEKDPDEQNHPMLIEECRMIKSRWTAVNLVRPLLSHPFRQADVPVALRVRRQRQQYVDAASGLEDLVGEAIQARLADLSDPAAHQSDALVRWTNTDSQFEHIICVR